MPDIHSNLFTLSPYHIARHQRKRLIESFWLLSLVLLIVIITRHSSLQSTFGALLVSFCSLLAPYLWISGRAHGLPIFPLFALSHLWSYALPLVSDHAQVSLYSGDEQLLAATKVSIFLLLATFVWLPFVNRASNLPQHFLALPKKSADRFFLIILASATFFQASRAAGWGHWLPGGTQSLFQAATLGLNVLAVFALSYKWGKKALSPPMKRAFIFLLILYFFAASAGLLLVYTITTYLLATVGYLVGSRKIPWRSLIIMFICMTVMHVGKGEMRTKYWFSAKAYNRSSLVEPLQYPKWFFEWATYGWQGIFHKREKDPLAEKSLSKSRLLSILDRTCVIHMLLRVQSRLQEDVPLLYGKTYAVIPQILVPRIIAQNKISSHEGTYLLNIHYGLQTRESTRGTTIGWGLLNEAYANFGLVGCLMLSVLLGLFYGWATRWTTFTPILSARAMFAILVMSLTINREMSAGVYVSVLFQATIVLTAFSFLAMRRHYISPQAKIPIL